jgi:hypothetical protein
MYSRPYDNLKKEGAKDVIFFQEQITFLQRILAKKSFGDLGVCFKLSSLISSLKELVKSCKAHNIHLEREERIEYKSYLSKLCGNITNFNGEEEPTRPSNNEPTKFKHEITWSA